MTAVVAGFREQLPLPRSKAYLAPALAAAPRDERFLEVLLAGWMLVFVAAAAVLVFPGLKELKPCAVAAAQIMIPLAALIAGSWRIVVGQKSGLRGRAFMRDTMYPYQ